MQVNGFLETSNFDIHASPSLPPSLPVQETFPPCFQNQNTTASVAMEMKYLHVDISNYAEILLVLTNHISEIS